MIDMNRSIEEIMQECDQIALDEFKSDIDAYYAQRRSAEKQSGNHTNTGIAKNHADAMNSRSAIHQYAKYKGYTANTKDRADDKNEDRKNDANDIIKNSEKIRADRKANGYNGKPKNESSIFDDLLDLV
jgi:hypothetical protein